MRGELPPLSPINSHPTNQFPLDIYDSMSTTDHDDVIYAGGRQGGRSVQRSSLYQRDDEGWNRELSDEWSRAIDRRHREEAIEDLTNCVFELIVLLAVMRLIRIRN